MNVKVEMHKCRGTVSRNVCLDTVNYLIEKVERRTRKPWITLEMISKMEGGSGRMSTTKREGRKEGQKIEEIN